MNMSTIQLPNINPQVTQFSFFIILVMFLYILSYGFSIENCFGGRNIYATEVDNSSSIDPAILGGIIGGFLTIVGSIVAVFLPFRKKINEDLRYRRIQPIKRHGNILKY